MQDSTNIADLNHIYRALSAACQDVICWSWDERFSAALATFDVTEKNKIENIIETHLTQTWDNASISDAPEIVVRASENYGGLQSGQLIFTTSVDHGPFLIGLWWPWGNGETISIRIVPNYTKLSEQEATEQLREFKTCFSV